MQKHTSLKKLCLVYFFKSDLKIESKGNGNRLIERLKKKVRLDVFRFFIINYPFIQICLSASLIYIITCN